MQNYDVVVVGAGNAGLIAAIEAQKSGKKTLLIEKNNVPGGAATSFRRGRFEIEASLHELCSVGSEENPGEVRRLLDELGVKVDWLKIPDCYRAVSTYSDGEKMDVTMPSGIENYIEAMEKYVPGSRDKMEVLFSLFKEVTEGMGYLTKSKGKPESSILMKKYPDLLITGAHSTKRVFDALKLPQKCQDILSVYWSYLGCDLERLSFLHYTAMVYSYIERGAYIPKGTSHSLSVAMTERLIELGGDISFNTKALSFIFKDGRCTSVETDRGLINARYVLADINPDIIYGQMMEKDIIPVREKKLSKARGGIYGGRMFTSYLCLDKSREELGINDYSIFLEGSPDSKKEYDNILKGMEANDFSIFLCYNVVDPAFSPAGTCVCSFTTFCSPDEWGKIKDEDYYMYKESVVKKMLSSLKEKTGIDLSGHIEEIETASPWTFSRYLGSPEGSAYGYETRSWDGMMARMMMIDKDYPLKGFMPIGTSGPRGDGYSSTMLTGQMLSKKAVKEMEEEENEK